MLESLDQEIARRGELFRNTGGQQMDLGGFRRATRESLPRIVLIIDEFHMLFERDDRPAQRAAELIDRVVRQGRAFGVHTILSSQSVSGGAQHIKTALNQISTRLVLASSETDSRMLLSDDNTDAQLLSKQGEGILNTKGGLKDANSRFQASYWSPEHRAEILGEMRAKSDRLGYLRRPVVFEGSAPSHVQDVPSGTFRGSRPTAELVVPIGVPMSLAGPISVVLRRAPGANLLIVDEQAGDLLTLCSATLLGAQIEIDLVDFGVDDMFADGTLDMLESKGVRRHHRRKLSPLLAEVSAAVTERIKLSDFRNRARVVILAGLRRAREFDPQSYDDDSETGMLKMILRDGPEVGVHVIASTDRPAALDRRLSQEMLREFGLRVLGHMSAEDSRNLTDTDLAAAVNASQVVFDDFDRATTVVARRFGRADTKWLAALANPAAQDS